MKESELQYYSKIFILVFCIVGVILIVGIPILFYLHLAGFF